MRRDTIIQSGPQEARRLRLLAWFARTLRPAPLLLLAARHRLTVSQMQNTLFHHWFQHTPRGYWPTEEGWKAYTALKRSKTR